MQNLLNGKDLSDIEFCPSKVSGNIFDDENLKENHSPVYGNPVVPLSPVEDVPDFTTDIVPKESDPMSMSFYQEEGNNFGTNPFDLNKVQLIPDNIEEIVESSNVKDEIMSSESQLGSVEKSPVDSGLSPEPFSPVESPIDNDICELPKTPVLDDVGNLPKTPFLDEICNLPKTLVLDEVCNLPKTPVLDEIYNLPKTPVLDEVCSLPKSPVQEDESCFMSKSPLLDEACSMSKSPVHSDVYSASPVQNVCELPKYPSEFSEPRKSPMPDVCDVPKSTVHYIGEIGQSPLEYAASWTHKLGADLPKLPVLDVHSPVELSSPVGPLSPKSPIPELTGLVSPDITASIKDENISGEICVTPKSPALDLEAPIIIPESPISEQLQAFPEVANVEEVKEVTFEAVSNFFNIEKKQIEDAFCELPKEEAKVEELISDAIQDISSVTETEHKLQDILGTMSNEINDMIDMDNKVTTNFLYDNQMKETEIDQPPKSPALESSVDPSEISFFLDRSDVPQVTSPLSPSEEIEKFQTERPELGKCEFSLLQASAPFEIKCETIKPEFPVHTIASPSEESKGTDTPPSTPAAMQEEPELKRGSPEPQKIIEAVEKLTAEKETLVKAAAVTVLATTGVVASATTKAAAKPKSASSTSAKKPLPSSKAPTSPTKSIAAPKTTPAARKTTSPSTLSSATSKLAANKTPAAKPKSSLTPSTTRLIPAAKPAPKARTPATTPTSKQAEAAKKPLTNGEVKPAPIRRPIPGAPLPVKASPAPPKTTTAAKPTTSRPSTATAAKTLTAAAKPAPRSASANLTAPKARAATLVSKATNGTSATTKVCPNFK